MMQIRLFSTGDYADRLFSAVDSADRVVFLQAMMHILKNE